jgi:hypothetical protein
MANRNRPGSVAEPTAADKLREAARDGDLGDPDATEVLGEVDTSRPLQMRNGEHGHIDGTRGLQDFHVHDDGGQPHGHRFRDKRLGRTAGLDEYVPPLAATDPPGADQTADPTPAGVPDPGEGSAPSAIASGEAGAGSDAAGSGRPTALALPGEVTHRGRLQAVERKVRARLAEVQVLTEVQDLVDAAVGQLDIGDLVGPAVIRQVKDTVDRWAAGRGLDR